MKTFFIYSVWDRHKQFIDSMKSFLIQRGWIESLDFPVDFMFLYFSYKIEPPILDTNQSKLVNLIKGNTFENLMNKFKYIQKFKYQYFMHPYKIIDTNNIININKSYMLYPIHNMYIDRLYTKQMVSSKDDIKKQIELHPEVKNWIIRDILSEPVLKNGHIFNLDFIFIVKLNPFKLYIIKNKQYVKSKSLYDVNEYKYDKKIFETFKESLNVNETQLFFPEDLPDGWNKNETDYINELIENSIYILFKDKIDLQPDNNSKNGYFIFNAFIRLYERLPPIIYYILNVFSPHLHLSIIPALISIIIDNKDHPDFKEIDLKVSKPIKQMINNTNNISNFKYMRSYSLGRTNEKTISIEKQKNSFYISMDEKSFEVDVSKYLENLGYVKSNNFPVDFILLSGESSYFRNRFNSNESTWISLLYGNSKTEITNKILLHKKYENAKFLKPSIYLDQTTQISTLTNLNETTIKILKPLNGFAGSGIKIVKTKNEIISWMKSNDNLKYKEWLLEDYIIDPDLKNGYKFHLRVLILVKVKLDKKPEIYIGNHKFYVIAKEKYKNDDWKNKNIHDTHYSPIDITLFPNEYPDNWSLQNIQKSIIDINNIITEIFNNKNDFKPEWNAKNGFEILGADIMFSNKEPFLIEINAKTGLKDCNLIIPGLISTILHNKENEYFTKLL